MASADFLTAISYVLLQEGGRVDDPRDPGGRTNLGITQHTYDAWRDAMHQQRADVFNITEAEAEAIYRNRYADPIHYDDLPIGVGYCVLDTAVMEGPVRAAKDLQAAVGALTDGQIGVITLAKARTFPNKRALVDVVCNARLGFLRRLTTYATFGRGWTARVEFVRSRAKAMIDDIRIS